MNFCPEENSESGFVMRRPESVGFCHQEKRECGFLS